MVVVNTISYLNSDRSLCVGTNRGFYVVKCDTSSPILLFSSPREERWDISMITHESGCRRVLFVTRNSPRVLNIFNLPKQQKGRNLNFTANITAFHINDQMIVVKVSSRLHLFDSAHVTPIGDVITDVDNESPALTMLNDLIVFPTCNVGTAGILKTRPSRELSEITCFTEQIAAFELSPDCYYLAVCSLSGKIIKVYIVEDATPAFLFVRGLLRPAKITSMFFYKLDYLVVASDTDSVHVFPLNENAHSYSFWNSIAHVARSSMRFLPIDSAVFASEQRSICTVKLPCGIGNQNRAFFAGSPGRLVLHVASTSGWVYEFNVDSDFGWKEYFRYHFAQGNYVEQFEDSDSSDETLKRGRDYAEKPPRTFYT